MRRHVCKSRRLGAKAIRGFSLVELTVAMALSLVLLGGVVAIFLSSRTTYETTDRLSRIQENGRFALDTIVRDLRSAGYLGCSRRAAIENTLHGANTTVLWNFAVPVQGFDAQGTIWSPALDMQVATNASTAVESDALVVRFPRGDFEPVRVLEGEFMSSTTADVVIANTSPALIEPGDIVQISDCNGRTVFQVTANAAGVISHALTATAPATTDAVPGNVTNDLGFAFTDAAELVPMQSAVYYLRNGSTPGAGTSLWRRVSGGGAAEELVEGVENMQVLFGVASGNTLAYRRADQVEAAGAWANVRTVRIALLVVSLSEYGTDTDGGTYQVLDETVNNPGDRRMRQVFTTTVAIRNTAT